MGRGTRGGAAILFALSLAGCYTYHAAELDRPPVGEQVRMTVTRAGASEYTEVTGRDEAVPRMEGELVAHDGGHMTLRIPVGNPMLPGSANVGSLIRIPEGEVLQLEQRELNRTRTALLVAGSTVAATALVLAIMDGFAGGPGIDPGDGDLDARPRPSPRILLSIPVPGRP
jgi:hypothetical protein